MLFRSVNPDLIRPDKIIMEHVVAKDLAVNDAVTKGFLDSDEYEKTVLPNGNIIYNLKGIKGIYGVQVMVEGDKSVIRVKSKVNTDDITLQDKNGTPIGNKSKNSTPGDKYKGYFEFTDVPVSKIREMFYIRIHNAGIPDGPDDHDETDNIKVADRKSVV